MKRKKTKKVVRRPVTVIQEDARMITLFCMTKIKTCEGSNLLMSEALEGYLEWAKAQGRGNTGLSVDGFGKLIPKMYSRRTLKTEYYNQRALLNVKLVK